MTTASANLKVKEIRLASGPGMVIDEFMTRHLEGHVVQLHTWLAALTQKEGGSDEQPERP